MGKKTKRNYFVEAGRAALINYGPNTDKLVVVLDIVDQSRALVEGPTSGIHRQTVPLTHLSLTPIKIDIPRGVRSRTLVKAVEEAKLDEQFAKTSWAKKIARVEKRKNLSDFDRFKLMVLKKKKSLIIGRELGKLKRNVLREKKGGAGDKAAKGEKPEKEKAASKGGDKTEKKGKPAGGKGKKE